MYLGGLKWRKQIKCIPSRTPVGPFELLGELLKLALDGDYRHGNRRILKLVHANLTAICQGGGLLQKWKYDSIIGPHKKKDPTNC